MAAPLLLALCALTAACALGCASGPSEPTGDPPRKLAGSDHETAQILAVLNGETRAARARDYGAWRRHWVHAPYVVKTYTNAVDGTSSVTLGWDAVDTFVRTYLEAHPEPDPPPPALERADVRLYGDAAWVTYVQEDPTQGAKRESRRLERVDGSWRIAGMHTAILGGASG